LDCGIPTVTLLGEREDWIAIQTPLEKLKTFGTEPEASGELLKLILRYVIETLGHPDSPAMKDFWSRIAHRTGSSGPHHLSRWITAFCFWDEKGNSLYHGRAVPPVSFEPFEWQVAGCELPPCALSSG
jgi:hypothetical protein